MPCGNEVKDWSQVAASPGTPNGARKPPKAQRGEGGSRPGPSEGARPSRNPDFRLPAPGAVTASRLLFLAPRHVVLRYGRLRERGRKEPCLGWEDGCDDPPGLSQGGSAGLPSPRQAGSDGLARCTAQSHCVFASLRTGVLLWANGGTTVLKPSFPVQLAVGSGLFGSRNVRACRHSQRQSSPPPAGHPDSRSARSAGGGGRGEPGPYVLLPARTPSLFPPWRLRLISSNLDGHVPAPDPICHSAGGLCSPCIVWKPEPFPSPRLHPALLLFIALAGNRNHPRCRAP